MGSLAQSSNVKDARVDKDLTQLIEQDIQKSLAPMIKRVNKCEGMIKSHNLRLDKLTVRVEALEEIGGRSSVVDTLKEKVATLRVEVVQIQYMDISTLWGEVPFLEVTEMPSVVPLATVLRAVVVVDA
ncbi:hypothetical protein KY285_005041 [Solanum tuberosum]|nr:hypothetical protein KY285_005041 [Solanum tuberosum]